MSKLYEYKILAKVGNNGSKSLHTYIARTEREARNLIKSGFPDIHIISCVRGCERKDLSNSSSKKVENNSSNGSNSIMLAAVSIVGGFLLSKIFSKEDK